MEYAFVHLSNVTYSLMQKLKILLLYFAIVLSCFYIAKNSRQNCELTVAAGLVAVVGTVSETVAAEVP